MSFVIAHHAVHPRSTNEGDQLLAFYPRATVTWTSVMVTSSVEAGSYPNDNSQENDEWHIVVDGSDIAEFFFSQGFSSGKPCAVAIPLGFVSSGITFTGLQQVGLSIFTNSGGGGAQRYIAMTWIGSES